MKEKDKAKIHAIKTLRSKIGHGEMTTLAHLLKIKQQSLSEKFCRNNLDLGTFLLLIQYLNLEESTFQDFMSNLNHSPGTGKTV